MIDENSLAAALKRCEQQHQFNYEIVAFTKLVERGLYRAHKRRNADSNRDQIYEGNKR